MIVDDSGSLNEYGIPVNAPIANGTPMESGYNFNSLNERGAIGAYNLGNFNFNSGTGGTIVLGGSAQGAGNLIVRNTAGGTIATIDSNGITVLNGSITIKNSGGTSIIDSVGLNSMNNFETQSTSTATQDDYTGTVYDPLPGGTVTTSNFSRPKTILVLFTSQFTLDGSGTAAYDAAANYSLFIDGTIDANMFMAKRAARIIPAGGSLVDSVQNVFSTDTMHTIESVGTGVHNIVIQRRIKPSSGTSVITMSTFRRTLSALVLGN